MKETRLYSEINNIMYNVIPRFLLCQYGIQIVVRTKPRPIIYLRAPPDQTNISDAQRLIRAIFGLVTTNPKLKEIKKILKEKYGTTVIETKDGPLPFNAYIVKKFLSGIVIPEEYKRIKVPKWKLRILGYNI